MAAPSELREFYEGWANHQRLLTNVIRGLDTEALASRPAPEHWSVWQLASHLAGARVYWFHTRLGEGDPALAEMFRVTRTTVPDLPIEDAGWEDDETHPRTAEELVGALEKTSAFTWDCIQRWGLDDLRVEFSRQTRRGLHTFSRAWVIWHVIEHDLHHGGEVSNLLGSHGFPALDM